MPVQPFIPVADTVQMNLYQRLHGQRVENTLYFTMEGGFGTAEVTDLWNNLLIWWNLQLTTMLSNDLSLVGGKATDLSSATSFALEFTAPTPNPVGDYTSAAMPGNVALCVSMRSLGRGRSSRGRNYIAGLTDGSITGNQVDALTASTIETAYQNIRSLPFTNPWVHVIVSRYHDGAARLAGISQPVVNCRIVDLYVDSMRRRLTGRGI